MMYLVYLFISGLDELFLDKPYYKMKILFIDTIHPLLKGELEKLNYNCDTAYKKSKSEIEEIISNYEGIIIRSRFKIDNIFII